MEDDLGLALRIAGDAAELSLRSFGGDVEASHKGDGSLVTTADLAVERLLRRDLLANRPGDAVLGEEYGLVGDGPRVWVIDPIDGTSFYAGGDPNWRVHVALQVDDRVVVAVVVAPALGLQWWASRGGGAFEAPWPTGTMDPVRLAVSTADEVAGSVADALPTDRRARLAPATIASPSPLPLVELVRGEIDAFVAECCEVWDHAPWILLTEEAGGRFTDLEGGTSGAKGGGLYSNTAIHDRLLSQLGYPTRPPSTAGDPTVTIRPATDEDGDGLGLIAVSASLRAFLGHIPEEYLDLGWRPEASAAGWRATMGDLDQDQLMLVAELEGVVVGFVWAGLTERAGEGEVRGLYVLPTRHGQGIGRRLISCAVDQLERRSPITSLIVGCIRESPSCGFYRHLGGVEAFRRPSAVDDYPTEEIVFAWSDLTPLRSGA